jgi:hypothetical protein
MSSTPSPSNSRSNLDSIFNAALQAYKKKTGKDITSHPLATELQSCDSPDEILAILRKQIPSSDQSQGGHEGFAKCLIPTVNVLYAFSATLGEGVGLVRVATPTRSLLRTSICALTSVSGVLTRKSSFCWHRRSPLGRASFPFVTHPNLTINFQVAKDVDARQGILVELLGQIEHFFLRLEIYTEVPPTTAMREITVEILAEVLTIIGIATKEVKRGRMSELISSWFTAIDWDSIQTSI